MINTEWGCQTISGHCLLSPSPLRVTALLTLTAAHSGSSGVSSSPHSVQESFPGNVKTDKTIHCVCVSAGMRAHTCTHTYTLSLSFPFLNVYISMFANLWACLHVCVLCMCMPKEAQGYGRNFSQPLFIEGQSISQTQSLWIWLVLPARLFWDSLSLPSEDESTSSLHTHQAFT